MRIALVSLPWPDVSRPSAALAALQGYLHVSEPSIPVDPLHFYVDVAKKISMPVYRLISMRSYSVGECLYGSILYPEQTERARAYFVERYWNPTSRHAGKVETGHLFGDGEAALASAFDDLRNKLVKSQEEAISGVDWKAYSLVGFSTSFGQLFAGMAFAKSLKERHPHLKIVFGGSTVSSQVGISLLKQYSFVDFLVQGEGEQPLLALVRSIRDGKLESLDCPGLISREGLPRMSNNGGAATRSLELKSLNDLGESNFEDHAARIADTGVDWLVPIEGSRGCWWDRANTTGDPKQTCYFCNLNVQWTAYREKTPERIVAEMVVQSEKYARTKIFFLDNIVRAKGVTELTKQIAGTGIEFSFFYEARASLKPREFLALWEAGLRDTQFGIEGLSTSFLKRIGKGTTAIQNLQVMKLCREFRVSHGANLIVDFPGSTEHEVAQTIVNIREYALHLEPLNVAPFWLGIDSTVCRMPEIFGIRNIRNKEFYRKFLPEEVYRSLVLFDKDYDSVQPPVSWQSVETALAEWASVYSQAGGAMLLYYQDGRSFLRINDHRNGREASIVLRGEARDLYNYCHQIRSLEEIAKQFVELEREEIENFLDQLCAKKLMYKEGGKYLSLACAETPRLAAKRIRLWDSDSP